MYSDVVGLLFCDVHLILLVYGIAEFFYILADFLSIVLSVAEREVLKSPTRIMVCLFLLSAQFLPQKFHCPVV